MRTCRNEGRGGGEWDERGGQRALGVVRGGMGGNREGRGMEGEEWKTNTHDTWKKDVHSYCMNNVLLS